MSSFFIPMDRVIPEALRAKKIRGVHLAIVTDNKDDPPDNPGYRVKVKIPTFNEDQKTWWARIAHPMAGNDRGSYFLPEVDDQLLVVFEHGDIDRPIIIGALWSQVQPPVEVNQSGNNNTKLIKSRSGHRIIFDDKDGAEKVIVVDNTKQNKIVLDSVNKIVKIECSGDIEVRAAQNVIMHSNALKVGTSQTLTGEATQVLTHSMSVFSVKSAAVMTIQGAQVQINVTNSPACQVSGSGSGFLGAEGSEEPEAQIAEVPRGQ